MRITVHAPFGALSQEAGVIFMLANYLRSLFPAVVQLKCNGVLSYCDRGGEENRQRGFDTCFRCMQDQLSLARWAGISSEPLSQRLLPGEIEATRRLVLHTPTEKLPELVFEELPLLELCRASFQSRFGVSQPDFHNKNHEQVLRRMMLAAARMCVAVKRFNREFMPDISLVAGGWDLISRSLVDVCRRDGYQAAVFRWDFEGGGINIVHPRTHQVLVSDLLLDGIASMRPDISTWPSELVNITGEILAFLDISDTQMTLPIAR